MIIFILYHWHVRMFNLIGPFSSFSIQLDRIDLIDHIDAKFESYCREWWIEFEQNKRTIFIVLFYLHFSSTQPTSSFSAIDYNRKSRRERTSYNTTQIRILENHFIDVSVSFLSPLIRIYFNFNLHNYCNYKKAKLLIGLWKDISSDLVWVWNTGEIC